MVIEVLPASPGCFFGGSRGSLNSYPDPSDPGTPTQTLVIAARFRSHRKKQTDMNAELKDAIRLTTLAGKKDL